MKIMSFDEDTVIKDTDRWPPADQSKLRLIVHVSIKPTRP